MWLVNGPTFSGCAAIMTSVEVSSVSTKCMAVTSICHFIVGWVEGGDRKWDPNV